MAGPSRLVGSRTGAPDRGLALDAAAVMSRHVITVTPETVITEAARLMLESRISGLPVVGGDGTVVGIITEGDLLRRAEIGTAIRRPRWLELLVGPVRLARDYVTANARKVGEVMTRETVSVPPDAPLAEIVRLMERHRVKRLPVIDAGRLVGIVSRADLVRALVGIGEDQAAARTDGAIRDHILAAIAAEPWAPRCDVSIWVKDGKVELGGTFTGESERAALRILAENTPGVKDVRDRLTRVEPMLGTVLPPEGSPPTIA
jgi:CBS domain-containing protein